MTKTAYSFFAFDRMNAARSLTLLGLGAIAGLAIAGVSLFTARGTSTLIVPPEDVATVNQRPISRLDFDAQLKSLYDVTSAEATPAQRKDVLDAMIREEVFVQRGLELDVAGVDPGVRAALVSAVEQQITADAETRQPAPTDLLAYYGQNQAKYMSEGTMTLRDMIAAPADADAAAHALRNHEDPDAVAVKFHLRDSGKVKGEEFYFAAEIHLGEPLFAAAEKLTDNTASDPLPQADGVHILMMTRNSRPEAVSFAAAKSQVLGDWRKDNSARLLMGDEAFLRKRANVLVAEDLR